jgi:peptide chain release factor 1
MGEGGSWGRIRQIIGWHVNGLDRGDGTLLGGGNSLLHTTHIGGEGWLVTDSGWNSTEQGRHLGTGLGESENVVNEEQHILSLLVSEVLGNGQTGKGDSSSGSRGLVHLTEHESDFGVTLEVDDTGLPHLVVQIVTLSGSLTDTGEDGVTTVGLGDVVDKLLDQHGLSDTGTTEKSDLTTSGVRGEEVDDLDTGLEDFSLGGLLNELWGIGVDRGLLHTLDWASLVDGLTNDVHDSTEKRQLCSILDMC